MRPLLFILADKDTREALLGLFRRDDWARSLGCRPIGIDDRDLVVPPGHKDPGVFKRAQELARPYLRTHEHLVVLLDCAWDGTPGRAGIERGIADDLKRNGWEERRFAVIAIEPELEVWLWSDAKALRRAFETELAFGARSTVEAAIDDVKGLSIDDPKARLACLRERLRVPASAAQFRRFAAIARLERCEDPAFTRLRAALRRWFPA